MDLDASTISSHLPLYLTDHEKSELANALDEFRRKGVGDYYSDDYDEQILQGDGWSGLKVVEVESLDRKLIKGVILNNTCDVSPENRRAVPHRIMFAPIVGLDNYSKLLRSRGVSEQGVDGTLEKIRAQSITNLFYLPVGPGVDKESVVVLDDVKSLKAEVFHGTEGKNKAFSLSMFGFYLFLFKLSIHFCRLHENIQR